MVLDKKLQVISASQAFYTTFEVAEKDTIGQPLPDLGNRQWNIPKLLRLLKEIIPEKKVVKDYEVEHKFEQIGKRTMILNACQLRVPKKIAGIIATGIREEEKLILMAIEDITERKRLREELEASEEYYRRAFETSVDGLLLVHKIEGHILDSNAYAQKLLGYSKEEFLKNKLWGIGVVKDDKDFQEALSRLERDGVIYFENIPVKTKEGLSIYIEAVFVDKAKVIQCNIRDNTARKKAEEELRKNEARLRDVTFSMADWVWEVDENGVYTYSSSKGLELLGDVIGKTPFDFMAPDEAKKTAAIFSEIAANKAPIKDLENWIIGKNGERICLLTNGLPILDEAGNFKGYRGVDKDISERKRREGEMQWKTALLEAQINATIDGILIVDEKGNKIIQNQRCVELWKIPKHVVDNRDDKQQIEFVKNRAKDPEKFVEQVLYLYAHPNKTSHDEVEFKDGMILDRYSAPVIGKDGTHFGRIWTFRDITERKRAEEELRKSEERFKLIFEYAPDAYYLNDLKGNFIDGNKAAEKMTGYNKEELIGSSFLRLKLLPLNEMPKAAKLLVNNAMGRSTGPDEFILRRKSGDKVSVEISTHPVKFENKTLVLGIARDITERKQAEEELKKAKISLDLAIDASQIGVWELDLIKDTSVRNFRHDQIFGYKEKIAEWGAKIFFEHIIAEDRPSVQAAFDSAMKTDRLYFECRILWPDKSIHWITATGKTVKDSAGKPQEMFGIVMDITERKKMEESSRLAQLGGLVSAMAHEVNNPLMIISGNAQLCLMEEIQSDTVKNNLKIIVEECLRAKDIIQRLLKFSRPSKGEIKETDINKSIEAIVSIVEHQFKLVNVEIKRNYLKNPPLISVDEKQMQEVFMNLINNAVEAMLDAGVITITTSLEGDFLRIDLKDTGSGMSEEAKKKVFEPFFTTKESGTGLGLPICYGFIKAHNGEIKFESELGKGTTATILLPLGGG